jgi:hypothetical protein
MRRFTAAHALTGAEDGAVVQIRDRAAVAAGRGHRRSRRSSTLDRARAGPVQAVRANALASLVFIASPDVGHVALGLKGFSVSILSFRKRFSLSL